MFIYGNRKLRNRWVRVDATRGFDIVLLLRLTVKYRIHPVALEDMASNSEAQMSHVEKYGTHFFMSMKVAQLRHASRTLSAASPPPVSVRVSLLNASISGKPYKDTIVTVMQPVAQVGHAWVLPWVLSQCPPEGESRERQMGCGLGRRASRRRRAELACPAQASSTVAHQNPTPHGAHVMSRVVVDDTTFAPPGP